MNESLQNPDSLVATALAIYTGAGVLAWKLWVWLTSSPFGKKLLGMFLNEHFLNSILKQEPKAKERAEHLEKALLESISANQHSNRAIACIQEENKRQRDMIDDLKERCNSLTSLLRDKVKNNEDHSN